MQSTLVDGSKSMAEGKKKKKWLKHDAAPHKGGDVKGEPKHKSKHKSGHMLMKSMYGPKGK